ncbi:MAG: SLBB domain-containing protein [Microcoleaceae cyanobacterium]
MKLKDLLLLLSAPIVWLMGVEAATAQLLPPPPDAVTIPVPAPPTAQPQPTAVSNDKNDYILGVGDRLQIDIFNVPEYSGEQGIHQVSVDGSLNLPLIGSVAVRGMTLKQVSDTLTEKYGEYLQRPLLTLTLLSARPLQIAVAGEVKRPGAYTLAASATPNTAANMAMTPASLKPPTLTRVIQMAGGVTALADVRQVKIRRSGAGGTEQVLDINLWELLQSGDLQQDIALRDGDTVYIPTVTELDRVEAPQLAAANFAGSTRQPINVAVIGEVNRPGTHVLEAEAAPLPESGEDAISGALPESTGVFTVTKALKAAGGITDQANIRDIKVRRVSRTGTQQVISVNLWALLQEGDVSQDVMLQSGDTIVIPTADNIEANSSEEVAIASFSPDNMTISVIGEVLTPGQVNLPPNTSLNQALLSAGGMNEGRADKDEVELIRLHPNGSISRQVIAVNFSEEVSPENNPTLRHNDVIIVGRSGGAAFRDGLGSVLGAISPLNGVFGVLRFLDIFD